MQYEYIGHVPNRHDWVKGKYYNINPRREKGLVVCNIQEVASNIDVVKPVLRDLIYDDVPMFRRDWKPVIADQTQGRTEAAELRT